MNPCTHDIVKVFDLGPVARKPAAAVIAPVPDDPLLMRCRVGQMAADPATAAVETIYIVGQDRQHQQQIISVLGDVHAAYGVPARIVLVRHLGTAASVLNASVQVSQAPLLVLLDGAVVPETPGWIDMLARPLRSHRSAGIVGGRLLRDDRTLWNDGLSIGFRNEDPGDKHDSWDLHPIHAGSPCRYATGVSVKEVAAVSPECIALPRSIIERCGGLSRRYMTSDYWLADFCLTAAAAGFKTCLATEATVFRLGSAGLPGRLHGLANPAVERDRLLLERRWRHRLAPFAPARRERAA